MIQRMSILIVIVIIVLAGCSSQMILMGDEIRRSQLGNNNAYCQDNETSWLNWSDVDKQAGLLRFFRLLITLIQTCGVFRQEKFWTGEGGNSQLTWHGARLGQPDWNENSHSLAFSLVNAGCSERLHIILNAYSQDLTFDLPPLPPDLKWYRLVDTSLSTPEDITTPDEANQARLNQYSVGAQSTVILLAK